MTPEVLPWNIRFIQEVEKRPCLYNYTIEDYTKKVVTDAAWQSVADEMGDTVHNCKEKWRNLRTVFVRKMKPTPLGTKRNTRPYYLTDSMQFLLPFVRVQHASKSSDTLKNDDCDDEQDDDDDYDDTEDFYDDDDDGERLETSSRQHEESNDVKCSIDVTPTITTGSNVNITENGTPSSTRMIRKRKRKVFKTTSVDSSEVLSKKARTSTGGEYDGCGDGDESRKLFLMSLVADVRAMSDAQMRKFRKLVLEAIDIVLDDIPKGRPRRS